MSIETKNETNKWRLPAEWEPQSMVQLTWPHAKTDWAPMLEEIIKTYDEMAREISKREELLIVGEPNNDTWARDHGFTNTLPIIRLVALAVFSIPSTSRPPLVSVSARYWNVSIILTATI